MKQISHSQYDNHHKHILNCSSFKMLKNLGYCTCFLISSLPYGRHLSCFQYFLNKTLAENIFSHHQHS